MHKLRGHHLICLHFFSGEGYDAAFTKNLNSVIAEAEEGIIEVHPGSDDICKKCPSLQSGKCMHSADAEDEIRLLDARALRLLGLSPGQRVGWRHIAAMLPTIFREWHECSCNECCWKWACEQKALYKKMVASNL